MYWRKQSLTMYRCNHFKPYELLPEAKYKELVDMDKIYICWLLFDDRVLKTLDLLRDKFGPIVLNDWYWGGNNQWRGWRPNDCPIGADDSQHKYGRAADPVTVNVTVVSARKYILANPKEFPFIRAVETTKGGVEITWIHFDVRNYTWCDSILKIKVA